MVLDVMLSFLSGFPTNAKIVFVVETVGLLSYRKAFLMDSCFLVHSFISLCGD